MYGIHYQQSVYNVHASSVNVFKIDKYLVKAGYT